MTAKEKLKRLAEECTEVEAKHLLEDIELRKMWIYNHVFREEVVHREACCTDRQLQFFRLGHAP